MRYLTVNVQTFNADFINRGIVRGWGSQKPNLELVTKRVGEYGLSPKDNIVAMVTDGASIIMKIRRIRIGPVEPGYHLCVLQVENQTLS